MGQDKAFIKILKALLIQKKLNQGNKPIIIMLYGPKEWRESNLELAKNGNIKDYTDLFHLVLLNNLQNINVELNEVKIS